LEKNFRKPQGGIFLTHTVECDSRWFTLESTGQKTN